MLAPGALVRAIRVAVHVHHVACIERMGVVPDRRVALMFLRVFVLVIVVFGRTVVGELSVGIVLVFVGSAQRVVPMCLHVRSGIRMRWAQGERVNVGGEVVVGWPLDGRDHIGDAVQRQQQCHQERERAHHM